MSTHPDSPASWPRPPSRPLDPAQPSSAGPATPSAPPGEGSARHAIWAIRLVPVGMLVAFLATGVVASLLGLPLIVDGGQYPSTAAQDLILAAVGVVVGLAAPTAALVLAIRALRAGHPGGTRLVAATAILLALLASFLIIVSNTG